MPTNTNTKRSHKPKPEPSHRRTQRLLRSYSESKVKRQQQINTKRSFNGIKNETPLLLDKIQCNITCAIWGHGALVEPQTPFINNYSNANGKVTLNVLGLGVSGVCSVSTLYTMPDGTPVNLIDEQLKQNIPLSHEYLTKTNNATVSSMYSSKILKHPAIITQLNSKDDIYSYVKNFGNTQRQRTDKIYSGETTDLWIRFIPASAHGPVVRVYNITFIDPKHNQVISIQKPIHDLSLANGSRIGNVLDHIVEYVKTQTPLLDLRRYIISPTIKVDIDIDVFDTTCNYTVKPPTMAYLENRKIREKSKQGKFGTLINRSTGGKKRSNNR
jgi:hypothetical protein